MHPNSRGCPRCGARREAHGWSRPEAEDGFDYDRFVEEEFGDPASPLRRSPRELFWWIVAVFVLAAFVLFILGFAG